MQFHWTGTKMKLRFSKRLHILEDGPQKYSQLKTAKIFEQHDQFCFLFQLLIPSTSRGQLFMVFRTCYNAFLGCRGPDTEGDRVVGVQTASGLVVVGGKNVEKLKYSGRHYRGIDTACNCVASKAIFFILIVTSTGLNRFLVWYCRFADLPALISVIVRLHSTSLGITSILTVWPHFVIRLQVN